MNIKKLFEAVEWSGLPPELEESNETLGSASPANQAFGEVGGLLGGFLQTQLSGKGRETQGMRKMGDEGTEFGMCCSLSPWSSHH